MCPFYMSLGMSYDEYWNGDNEAPKFYREAYEIKKEQKNRELWLQGMYIYDALTCVAPIMRAFGKPKLIPYPKEPYAITQREREDKEKAEMMKIKASMETWMKRINQ